jgi:uncharacterized protein YPO0396
MDAIKSNQQLQEQIEDALDLAVEIRDELKSDDPLDVRNLRLALDTVKRRIEFLVSERERKKAAKAETKAETAANPESKPEAPATA